MHATEPVSNDSAAANENSWASKTNDPLYRRLACAYKTFTKDNPDAPEEETTNFLKQTYRDVRSSPQALQSTLGGTQLSDIGSVGRKLLVDVMSSLRNEPETVVNAPHCEPKEQLHPVRLKLRRLSGNNIKPTNTIDQREHSLHTLLGTDMDDDDDGNPNDSDLNVSRPGAFNVPNQANGNGVFTELTPHLKSRYKLETKIGEGGFGKVPVLRMLAMMTYYASTPLKLSHLPNACAHAPSPWPTGVQGARQRGTNI